MTNKQYTDVWTGNSVNADRLHRRELADSYRELIERLPEKNDAWVLNLDAKYGSGKTYFISNWQKDLTLNHQYITLHFDAWKHDFTEDPFTSFAAEIIDQMYEKAKDRKFKKKLQDGLKELLQSYRIAWRVIDALKKTTFQTTLGKFLPELGDIDKVKNEVKEFVEIAGETSAKKEQKETLGIDPLKTHLEKRESLATFNKSLGNVADAVKKATNHPLVIFIDELDRCQPLFTVKLLERLKHVFNVKNIVFIVVTYRRAIENSLAALHGEQFEASEYLERFFDLSLTLPPYSPAQFIKIREDDFTLSSAEKAIYTGDGGLAYLIGELAKYFHLHLRELDKAVNLAILHWPTGEKTFVNEGARIAHQFAVLYCSFAKYCKVHDAMTDIIKINNFDSISNKWNNKTIDAMPHQHTLDERGRYIIVSCGRIIFSPFNQRVNTSSLLNTLPTHPTNMSDTFPRRLVSGLAQVNDTDLNSLKMTEVSLSYHVAKKLQYFGS